MKHIGYHISHILQLMGEDVNREGLTKTPERVEKAYGEIFAGYSTDIASLFTSFESPADEMVILKNIEFYSMCEHHMMPFHGKAHVAYVPNGRVIGVSKLARILDAFSRRLQIQERIGDQVVDALMEHLDPLGAGCILEAQHFCIACRGVGKQNSVMVTSSLRGVLKTSSKARSEFLQLIR